MEGINYKKILKQLIEEYPHELKKIKKVIYDGYKNGESVDIEFSEIIESNVWSSSEKASLLSFLGYNKNESNLRYYLDTIKYDNLSGFEALIKLYKFICRDEVYREIFNAVINNCKEESKGQYIKAILDNLTDEDIKRLITPYYEGDCLVNVHNESIFINIIASKDLNLIKNYMDYVDNINMYLSEAVATGNIEIVKLFLEKGANINYLTDEVILGRLTPLKTSIVNNDYEMTKFLIDNGADVDLQVNSDDFINRLNNYQIYVVDKWRNIEPLSIDPVNEEDKDAKHLKYIRTSSPLEYAIKLIEKCNIFYNQFIVKFDGETYNLKSEFLVDIYNISEQVKIKGKIVDLIFDKLEDKTNINFSDLIGFTFISRDSDKFKKYSKYAIDNNYQIDFDFLFELYFDFHLDQDKKMAISFFDLIEKYDKDNDIYLRLFDYYVNSEINYRFYVNDFNKELLNRISVEKRKKICLIPYCKDIDTLKYLISLGFDINQVDENSRNILFYLLCNRGRTDDLDNREIKLFNYLIENANLSMKDNNNKTALYYAMQKFDTKDEYLYARKNWIGTRSNLEKAVAILISRMPKQDVCNDDIKKVLEERTSYSSDFGEKIHLEYVYQHHKELFDALIDKGFVLSDKILNNIFASLYPIEDWKKERLLNSVDMDNTLDFLYTRLDYNLLIQKIDINKEFKNLLLNIDSKDITFDEFLRSIDNFNNQIISLNQFYKNNIKKRFNPERYLGYAFERYNTEYGDLNIYLLLIIIKGIKKFGNEKLVDILNSIPNYDINSYVVDTDIDFNYWSYVDQISDMIDEDCDEHFEADNVYCDCMENIEFSGGLMQYAILIDNLPMVQLLQERGASLKFLVDGIDRTWDYVNSYTMLNYIESFVGKKKFSSLNESEKDYYLDLVNPNIENNDNQQKKLVLKKDD